MGKTYKISTFFAAVLCLMLLISAYGAFDYFKEYGYLFGFILYICFCWFVLSLRATVDGYYTDVRNGTIWLNAGDVWKYGETINGANRYSDKELRENHLQFVEEYYGNQYQCKAVEKAKILNYFKDNWTLPPGNKIFR